MKDQKTNYKVDVINTNQKFKAHFIERTEKLIKVDYSKPNNNND